MPQRVDFCCVPSYIETRLDSLGRITSPIYDHVPVTSKRCDRLER
jgi:hypothetical protein